MTEFLAWFAFQRLSQMSVLRSMEDLFGEPGDRLISHQK